MYAIGVMTGTSVDAIDVALCDFSSLDSSPSVALLDFYSAAFKDLTRDLILRAISNNVSVKELSDIPFMIAKDYAEAIQVVVDRNKSLNVSCIGAHGQTIWHNPPFSTYQVLNGPALAQLSGIPTVFDFRSADVALGGQGAPLVPIFDQAFFTSNSEHRALLNLGGIANITVLPAQASVNDVIAFDSGPGNVLIDAAAKLTFGKGLDHNGNIARAGAVSQPFLNELKSLEYYSLNPPKSTGRELFTQQYIEKLITKFSHPSAPSEDVVATITALTVWSVADHLQRFAPNTTELICSGGGTNNSYLMEQIALSLPDVKLSNSSDHGIPSNAKEAMCFAYLGALNLVRIPGNIPSVTGASKAVVLGALAAP